MPWRAAKACFENQRDFNYLEARHLAEDAEVTPEGVSLQGMRYGAVIVDGAAPDDGEVKPALNRLSEDGRLIHWLDGDAEDPGRGTTVRSAEGLVATLDQILPADVIASPASPALRYRHVEKLGTHYYLLVNEGRGHVQTSLTIRTEGNRAWVDPWTAALTEAGPALRLDLDGYGVRVLTVTPA